MLGPRCRLAVRGLLHHLVLSLTWHVPQFLASHAACEAAAVQPHLQVP